MKSGAVSAQDFALCRKKAIQINVPLKLTRDASAKGLFLHRILYATEAQIGAVKACGERSPFVGGRVGDGTPERTAAESIPRLIGSGRGLDESGEDSHGLRAGRLDLIDELAGVAPHIDHSEEADVARKLIGGPQVAAHTL